MILAETILIRVTGRDQPGITTAVMSILAAAEAVIAIAISITHMSGVAKAALNISPMLTPACTPSVSGKGSRRRSAP